MLRNPDQLWGWLCPTCYQSPTTASQVSLIRLVQLAVPADIEVQCHQSWSSLFGLRKIELRKLLFLWQSQKHWQTKPPDCTEVPSNCPLLHLVQFLVILWEVIVTSELWTTVSDSTSSVRWCPFMWLMNSSFSWQELSANKDQHIVVTNWFSQRFRARFVRLNPTAWKTRICLRAELYGCETGKQPHAHAKPTLGGRVLRGALHDSCMRSDKWLRTAVDGTHSFRLFIVDPRAWAVRKWTRNLRTKLGSAYQQKEIEKRMTHFKITFTTGFIKRFSEIRYSSQTQLPIWKPNWGHYQIISCPWFELDAIPISLGRIFSSLSRHPLSVVPHAPRLSIMRNERCPLLPADIVSVIVKHKSDGRCWSPVSDKPCEPADGVALNLASFCLGEGVMMKFRGDRTIVHSCSGKCVHVSSKNVLLLRSGLCDTFRANASSGAIVHDGTGRCVALDDAKRLVLADCDVWKAFFEFTQRGAPNYNIFM